MVSDEDDYLGELEMEGRKREGGKEGMGKGKEGMEVGGGVEGVAVLYIRKVR